MRSRRRWAIVLAAGDGERVREITADSRGKSVPKQYWAPPGMKSMLRWTYDRARRIASAGRVLTVVSEQHREWWEDLLPASMTPGIVIQPRNRGTAAGILLPLLQVLRRDHEAIVAILPSDHHVDDEAILEDSLQHAFTLVEGRRRLALLGARPRGPYPGYGWILSGPVDLDGTRPIESVVEKPEPPMTRKLYRAGAYWSTLMLVARGSALLALFQKDTPHLFRMLAGVPGDDQAEGTHFDPAALAQAYEGVPSADFSRDLLQRSATSMRVLPIPPCGWTDLGTPERLEAWLRERKREPAVTAWEPTAA